MTPTNGISENRNQRLACGVNWPQVVEPIIAIARRTRRELSGDLHCLRNANVVPSKSQ